MDGGAVQRTVVRCGRQCWQGKLRKGAFLCIGFFVGFFFFIPFIGHTKHYQIHPQKQDSHLNQDENKLATAMIDGADKMGVAILEIMLIGPSLWQDLQLVTGCTQLPLLYPTTLSQRGHKDGNRGCRRSCVVEGVRLEKLMWLTNVFKSLTWGVHQIRFRLINLVLIV